MNRLNIFLCTTIFLFHPFSFSNEKGFLTVKNGTARASGWIEPDANRHLREFLRILRSPCDRRDRRQRSNKLYEVAARFRAEEEGPTKVVWAELMQDCEALCRLSGRNS